MSPGGLQGDEGELFERYAARLERVTAMLVNTSRDIVEEACAHTFAQLIIYQPRRDSIWAWLKTVARNEAIRLDQLARRTAPAEHARDPEDRRASTVVVDAMLDAQTTLERLNPRERQVIVVVALGWTYAEIADDLGVSPTRAQQIALRASEKLRRLEEAERVLDHPRAQRLQELEKRPPTYLVNSIGRPPRAGVKFGGAKLRMAWRRLALAIDDYRTAHGVRDTARPLGTRPSAGEAREFHDELGVRIAAFALQRGLDSSIER